MFVNLRDLLDCVLMAFCFFFFQAEDGIRDADVTGVQTCALPISATSHKAIVTFLEEVDACADEEHFDFRGWKKAADEDANNYDSDRISSADKPPKGETIMLVAGTAWLWAHKDEFEAVDVLFVDEA